MGVEKKSVVVVTAGWFGCVADVVPFVGPVNVLFGAVVAFSAVLFFVCEEFVVAAGTLQACHV
jgi:hypothetical protein